MKRKRPSSKNKQQKPKPSLSDSDVINPMHNLKGGVASVIMKLNNFELHTVFITD